MQYKEKKGPRRIYHPPQEGYRAIKTIYPSLETIHP